MLLFLNRVISPPQIFREQITVMYSLLCNFTSFLNNYFLSAGCDVPVQPVNGRFSGFTSAKVGSKVTYDCDDGLNLAGKRVAMCTEHRVWAPMGSEVMCTPSGTVLSTNTLNFNLTYSTTIPITTTTTTSSSQSLSVGVVAGIVVVAVLSLVVVILIASVTIFVLLLKKISKS